MKVKISKKELSATQEYWKRVCEKDAAWKAFCSLPSEGNWALYIEAAKSEQIAELNLSSFDGDMSDEN